MLKTGSTPSSREEGANNGRNTSSEGFSSSGKTGQTAMHRKKLEHKGTREVRTCANIRGREGILAKVGRQHECQ
jgi:hypothetical protein